MEIGSSGQARTFCQDCRNLWLNLPPVREAAAHGRGNVPDDEPELEDPEGPF